MLLLLLLDLLFYTQMLEPVFRGLSRDRGQEEALWFSEVRSAAYTANAYTLCAAVGAGHSLH